MARASFILAFSLLLVVFRPSSSCSNDRPSSQQSVAIIPGGIVVTTTTTILDGRNSINKSGDNLIDNVRSALSDHELEVIKSSWSYLKKRGNFAPKVFLRYFKAKPEALKLFPAFANVPLSELPANTDFLNQAFSCVSSLNLVIPHLPCIDSLHPCPDFDELKGKYNEIDLKKFGGIWLTAMQEEMGGKFTAEVRDAWKNALVAFNNFASTPSAK